MHRDFKFGTGGHEKMLLENAPILICDTVLSAIINVVRQDAQKVNSGKV